MSSNYTFFEASHVSFSYNRQGRSSYLRFSSHNLDSLVTHSEICLSCLSVTQECIECLEFFFEVAQEA